MKMARIKYILPILILAAVFCALPAFAGAGNLWARDTALWGLPKLPGSQMVWEDKPIEVNDIRARGDHLRSSLSFEEILSFYEDYFSSQGWELRRNLTENIFTFVKDNRFVFLGLQCHGERQPCDVYIVSSPTDLAICKVLEKYFLKEQMAVDVPGKDLPDVLRYPGSKRRLDILSPEIGAILVYEADAQPQDIAKFYRQALKQVGWREERALMANIVQRLSPKLKDTAVLLFYHNEDTLLINVTRVPEKFPGEKTKGRSFIIISKNMVQEMAYQKNKEGGR